MERQSATAAVVMAGGYDGRRELKHTERHSNAAENGLDVGWIEGQECKGPQLPGAATSESLVPIVSSSCITPLQRCKLTYNCVLLSRTVASTEPALNVPYLASGGVTPTPLAPLDGTDQNQ